MPGAQRPTLTLEIAFASAAFAVATWVDVTAYVLWRNIKITRGRNYEQDQFESGSIDGVDLDNTLGYFSANNTASPYYPNILPLKQVRMRAAFGGVTYDLFRGYITAWTPDITLEQGRNQPIVHLAISDIFARLAKMDIKTYTLDDNLQLFVSAHNDTAYDNQPTEYRYIAFVGNLASVAGTISISGITLEAGSITEGFALNGTTEVRTSRRFITITNVAVPARTVAGEIVTMYTWGFAAEFCGDASNSLLDAYEIPSDRRNTVGTFQVVAEDMPSSGDTLLGRLQKIATTEGGRVYVAADGRVTMEARYVRSLVNLTGTFDDQNTTRLTYTHSEYSFDDSLIVNTITYSTPGAPDGKNVQNSASVTAYGRLYGTLPALYSTSTTLITTTATIAANRYATPQERVNTLSFMPNSQPTSLWPVALGMEISQYFRVISHPPNGTTRDSYVFVERVEHSFTDLADWTVTLMLSPENANVFFTLDKHMLDDGKQLGY